MKFSLHILSGFLPVLLLCAHCISPGPEINQLGYVELEVTGSKEAMPYFEKGLLLLHSFEYEDAAEQFRNARDSDPSFIMAYWGEAMTKNHPLWSAQYLEEAREILNELGDTKESRLDMAKTDLEKDFLESVEILYGEGEKTERDKAYSAHMAKLYEKYPGSHEVAAFYALSLLGSVMERDDDVYGKGAIVAQGILRENPNHPGALHYMIHSYDDPGHAHLALEAADEYAEVAPDAAHALHMPSHIYVALGMWDEVIRSNIASYEASLKRKERKDLGTDERNYHAFHWLQYGYLQKGETEKAREMLDQMMRFKEEGNTKRTRAYLSMVRGTYIAETGLWDSDYADLEIKDDDLNISIRSTNDFIRGMKSYTLKDPFKLRKTIDNMQSDRLEAETDMFKSGAAMCSGVSWVSQLPTRQDINHAHIMEMELEALLADLQAKDDEAEDWLKKATDLEENTSFMFGPPMVIKPSHELYGEWLLKRNRLDLSSVQFEKCLERAPKRLNAQQGKEQST